MHQFSFPSGSNERIKDKETKEHEMRLQVQQQKQTLRGILETLSWAKIRRCTK